MQPLELYWNVRWEQRFISFRILSSVMGQIASMVISYLFWRKFPGFLSRIHYITDLTLIWCNLLFSLTSHFQLLGIFALSGYIGETKSLTHLDLRLNTVDLAGIMALTRTMKMNQSLNSLLMDSRRCSLTSSEVIFNLTGAKIIWQQI